ncbi:MULTISPECIES: hypothetical protein [unclassified Mesorhizobium]|uniref:hypothetical protein n=1 Tax=unclassified Mesorhizobium TaxID=325217 RepID=UPI001926C7B5|nr:MULTISPECIES: hypothetical protein [unclassified Mesorhizobium]BCG82903.1 hypothetical protein MesoLj113b_64450 [Mesorhizobium sp. 113-3-3]BCG90780.1 hypothetical protein MesoLj113c_68900 [Mesorhizobium sp. 113-3-9]
MAKRIYPTEGLATVSEVTYQPSQTVVQYHAWPQRYVEMAGTLAAQYKLSTSPTPGKAVCGAYASLLRVHPQRLWLVGGDLAPDVKPDLPPDIGCVQDLSHAWHTIQVDSSIASQLLNQFVSVNLVPQHFPVDSVALTPLHGIGVVLWCRPGGISVLTPRSFAQSIWHALVETRRRLPSQKPL